MTEFLKYGPPEPHWTDGLSIRATNVLCNNEINSREETIEAFQSGKLRPGNYRGTRNYGWKTHKEVAKWLGLPEPQRPFDNPRICPHCGKNIRKQYEKET